MWSCLDIYLLIRFWFCCTYLSSKMAEKYFFYISGNVRFTLLRVLHYLFTSKCFNSHEIINLLVYLYNIFFEKSFDDYSIGLSTKVMIFLGVEENVTEQHYVSIFFTSFMVCMYCCMLHSRLVTSQIFFFCLHFCLLFGFVFIWMSSIRVSKFSSAQRP